jgi:hypothetical protein
MSVCTMTTGQNECKLHKTDKTVSLTAVWHLWFHRPYQATTRDRGYTLYIRPKHCGWFLVSHGPLLAATTLLQSHSLEVMCIFISWPFFNVLVTIFIQSEILRSTLHYSTAGSCSLSHLLATQTVAECPSSPIVPFTTLII